MYVWRASATSRTKRNHFQAGHIPNLNSWYKEMQRTSDQFYFLSDLVNEFPTMMDVRSAASPGAQTPFFDWSILFSSVTTFSSLSRMLLLSVLQ